MKSKHVKTWNYTSKEATGWILGDITCQLLTATICRCLCMLWSMFFAENIGFLFQESWKFTRIMNTVSITACSFMSWKTTLSSVIICCMFFSFSFSCCWVFFFHSSNAQALGTWLCFGTSHFFEIARTLRISYACCSKARNLRIWYAIQHQNWSNMHEHMWKSVPEWVQD